jgi:acylphosphatase
MYGATGWVRNNPDGTVTMEIQSTQGQIDNVISALKNGRFISIDRMDVTLIPVAEDERDFRYMI